MAIQEERASSRKGQGDTWRATRTVVLRDAVAIGLATGTYGLSFGALSTAAGLSIFQTSALSTLLFTGASQFALVGVVAAGGNPLAGAATAVLLGSRNGLYGLHLSTLLGAKGMRKLVAAHFLIDESAAMAVGRDSARASRLGYWATGLSVFVFWNVATLIGAFGAQALSDPRVLGLDVVAPAAFVALLAPRMRAPEPWVVGMAAALVALASVPFVAAGIPVLLAALVAAVMGLCLVRWGRPGATAGRGRFDPAVGA